ncbi:MAG: hypothetical protein ACLR1V_13635 [Coprococcus sp.]
MKTAVISFTQNGNACNRRIITGLKMAGYTTESGFTAAVIKRMKV